MDFKKLHDEIKGYTQDTQPGSEKDMHPNPVSELDSYKHTKISGEEFYDDRILHRYFL
ncbi:hypothetical protein MTQ94_04685 [Staphylococcus agnetis]|uniref:hypothetical protein n=1 Tax=Staphylococcus agnetis TaxID=985762 RepID=UPI00208F6603|nr:hypothetical protein [Staphylococcus agnetis]MCO4337951.1 hypothetical protein [Staphylococcus agnetis]MCO4340238.1 hypothetical protein [Staphylococcus agnetis]MCO4343076.1 hypothetical protein [Staphylococcus agnetis]MCO4345022.1 hypothetical protein [Staphylococcus agnetis]MCO4347202.1 hypothetical protein [Staphylococcus agnetis]